MTDKRFTGNEVELLDAYGILHIGPFPFLFDIEDAPVIQSRVWYRDKDGYLVSCYYYNGQKRFVRFHRIIMHALPGQVVDHINKNRADNRKQNLRCCDRAENIRNRGLYSTNTSGVTGVFYDNQRGKWVASITFNNKRHLLGRFETKEGAVEARIRKELELFWEFAPQKNLVASL